MRFLDAAAFLDLSLMFGIVYGLTALGYDLGWPGLLLLALLPVNWMQFARLIDQWDRA